MRSRNLIILAVVVAALAAYIFIHERHQMTSDERRERADKVFPELEQDSINGLEIRNTHGSFRLAKEAGEWRLVEPIDFPANTSAVSGLIRSIENLEADRTLSTDEVELAAYGLDDPKLAIALSAEDGSEFTLAVGDEAALGSNRAMRRGDEAAILLGSAWWVSDLDKPLEDWRSRDVAKLTADEVASLLLVAGGDRVRVTRTNGVFTLDEPIEDLADQDHVRNLLTDLNALRIEEFVDDSTDPEDLGLGLPAYDLTIERSGGQPPLHLEFGTTRTVDGATQVGCRRGGEELFWVTDRAMTRLAKAPVRWRSSRVYTFDTWDAEGLTLTRGDSSVSLTREGGIWEAAGGTGVDHTAVQRRLTTLAELEAIEFDLVQPGTPVMGTVQLVLPGDDEDPAPIEVGYTFHRPLTDGGQAMVVVTGRSTVMSVDAAKAEEVLSNPQLLLKVEESEAGGESQEAGGGE